jgi:hypothetical protein
MLAGKPLSWVVPSARHSRTDAVRRWSRLAMTDPPGIPATRVWLLLAIAGCGGKVIDGNCSALPGGTSWSCASFTESDASPRTVNECLWATSAGMPCTQSECFQCNDATGTDWVCLSQGMTPLSTIVGRNIEIGSWKAAGTYSCKP